MCVTTRGQVPTVATMTTSSAAGPAQQRMCVSHVRTKHELAVSVHGSRNGSGSTRRAGGLPAMLPAAPRLPRRTEVRRAR